MNSLDLTLLYCPGTRVDLLDKAYRGGADVVIYDLEDSVFPTQKDQARENLRNFLSARTHSPSKGSPKVQVRINGIDTPWMKADIQMLAEVGRFDAVRIPKVESSAQIAFFKEIFGEALGEANVYAVVESAKGLSNLEEICASEFISGVSLGDADIRSQLRLRGDEALDHFRIRLVLALAANDKPAPVGAVYLNLEDMNGLFDDTRHLRDLGFIGRCALHPKQLSTIRRAFEPNTEEIERAYRILEAATAARHDDTSGAFTMPDGQFVDAPIIAHAEGTLALAESMGLKRVTPS